MENESRALYQAHRLKQKTSKVRIGVMLESSKPWIFLEEGVDLYRAEYVVYFDIREPHNYDTRITSDFRIWMRQGVTWRDPINKKYKLGGIYTCSTEDSERWMSWRKVRDWAMNDSWDTEIIGSYGSLPNQVFPISVHKRGMETI